MFPWSWFVEEATRQTIEQTTQPIKEGTHQTIVQSIWQ
jgi:hypothetical protein